MSDNIKFDYKNLSPFKWFVLENFPFIEADFDALTEWQLFCKIGKEINKIIDSQNIVGEQAETLTNAFNNLKNYIDNYFNNLDVQDEINNKLNEMVEDGTLEKILLNYSSTSKVYNTYQDLLNDKNNFVVNQKLKTLGYYNINDGGNCDYIVTDEKNYNYAIDLNNNLFLQPIIKDTINVKIFGCHGDGINDDSSIIQYIMNTFLQLNKTIYFPAGNYLINNSIDIPVENYSSIILDNNARIFSNTHLSYLFNITTNASFFTIDGGIFDGNNIVDIGIFSSPEKNKYSPTYKNIFFKDFVVSSMKLRTLEKKGNSEHGFIMNCKFYNTKTLATCLSIYTHDYTISNCEFFYTNIAIISTGFLLMSNCHIWAGGSENTNITKGILFTGDRLILNNMYFDGMNICIDTDNTSQTIFMNNSTCLFPLEGTYEKPIIVKNTIYGRTYLNNIDIKSYKERVSKIKLSNYDPIQFNSYTNCINGVYETYQGNEIQYDYNLIDVGDNINYDNSNCKVLSKGYNQTLENGKYYQIGYILLRSGSVTGFDLTFTCDDINKYTQRVKCSLYNPNDLIVNVQSNLSKYEGEEGRYGIAIGNAITLSDGSNNIKCCPIYLHVVNTPGNGFGICVTNNIKTTGNCIIFNNPTRFNTTPVENPDLLFDDITNS